MQMYGAIGQKHVTLYLGMLPRVFGIEIAHLALSQHPDGMIKKSQILFFVNIDVKVRSGCISDRKYATLGDLLLPIFITQRKKRGWVILNTDELLTLKRNYFGQNDFSSPSI